MVVRRVQHLGERGLDLEAQQEGVEQAAPVGEGQLAGGEPRGEHGGGGVPHHAEVRVVEVEGVRGGAVGEGGPYRARAQAAGADDGGERRAALGYRHPPHDARGLLDGAGQHHAERVQDSPARGVHRLCRALLEAALDDELGDGGGGAGARHGEAPPRMACAERSPAPGRGQSISSETAAA
jgi:hypothetical protein